MTRTAAIVGLVLQADLAAHRLDEYLQATRVSLDRSEVALEIDLTPGANVAGDIIARIDRDGDRSISPAEAEAYGRQVLNDVTVTLDRRPIGMTLTSIEVPSVGEIRDGLGTLKLRATAPAEAAFSVRRDLYVRNAHLPESSVYMVNALLPDDRAIEVVKQVRDPRQSTSSIEYRVESRDAAPVAWVLFGLAGVCALMAFRRHQGIRVDAVIHEA